MRDGGGDAERQFPGSFAVGGAKGLFGFRDESGELVGVIEKDRALASERNPAGGAIKEADAEIIFESPDLQRNRGLRKEETLTGFSKTELLGDGAEDFKSEVLEL